jgi:hypothetical protein
MTCAAAKFAILWQAAQAGERMAQGSRRITR